MSYAYRETSRGFVVAEEAMDEVRLSRALKQFDRRLVLQFRPPFYVVVCQVNDHYAPVVATWMDLNGKPLPLSSGLLEKVQMWHVGSRATPETADEYNARRLAEAERDRARASEAIRDDHRPYVERGRVQVTMADVGKLPYWKRQGVRPKSGAPR